MDKAMPITKIVSGGQTGADRGGLDAAIHAGISHGGWCPKGRKAEDGDIPSQYQLTETASASYVIRTEWNVRDSDATIIFTDGALSGGSLKTQDYAKKHKKPVLHVDLAAEEYRVPGLLTSYRQPHIVKKIMAWLAGIGCSNQIGELVLNVAGQRGSKAEGLQHRVKILMVDVLCQTNPGCCHPINDEG